MSGAPGGGTAVNGCCVLVVATRALVTPYSRSRGEPSAVSVGYCERSPRSVMRGGERAVGRAAELDRTFVVTASAAAVRR
jgi:hypothetical protein